MVGRLPIIKWTNVFIPCSIIAALIIIAAVIDKRVVEIGNRATNP